MNHTERLSFSARARRVLLVSGLILLPTVACTNDLSKISNGDAVTSSAAAVQTSIARLDPALDKLIAPGAKLELVADGFTFVEGPVWTHGRLWFSDLMANKLYAVGSVGPARLLLENSGGLSGAPHSDYPGSNGAVVNRDGTVFMAQHGARRIMRISRDLKAAALVERDAQGRRLNSPNDLAFAPDGALWFTDPAFGLLGGDDSPQKEIPFNGVYRLKDGKLSAAIVDLPNPNGIAFSPDGRTLYVSNSGPDMFVNAYAAGPDGAVGQAKRLIGYDGPRPSDVPDGMKVDSLGNIWASGPGGIRIITPQGKVLGQLKTPDPAQANLVWGGPDLRTVYIAASSRIYRLRLKVPGLKPLYTN